MQRRAIGIDLGTTNSCIAVYKDNVAQVLPNEEGKLTTPSWVAFEGNRYYVGEMAQKRSEIDPKNSIYDVKRMIGLQYSDRNVQEDMKKWPFKVINQNDKPFIQVQYMNKLANLAPQEISAILLEKLKAAASSKLNQDVTDAVITVPAYFGEAQKQATKEAGKIAGLNVLRLVSEPTAAAIAFGLGIKGHVCFLFLICSAL